MVPGAAEQRRRAAVALGVLAAIIATVGVLIAVLQRPTTHAPMRPTPSQTTMPTPTLVQAPPDLSGSWGGECTGPFKSGGCSLILTHGVNELEGTFILPTTQDVHVSGSLTGSTVSFGAVGVVTFTGTLSASTMSGTYTDIANGKKGSWSVTLSP